MTAWDDYAGRLDVHGNTKRSASLIRYRKFSDRHMPDSLSYQTVEMDGVETNVAILNSDNLNEKYIYSMPGEDIALGGLVLWEENYWLITERDAANEVYTRGKLLQCNYLLKWIDAEHVIHEQWCAVEDGTKLKRNVGMRNSLACWKRHVKTTPLIAGNPLEPGHQNGAANSRGRNGLKTAWIGKSAAKPRTEEGSTTIAVERTGTSVLKRGALNRHRRHGEDIVCAPVKAGGVRKHRRGGGPILCKCYECEVSY